MTAGDRTICKRCVLPESKPDIWLDDRGICNICIEHEAAHEDYDGAPALETDLTSSNKEVAKLDAQVQTLLARFNVTLAEITAQPDIEGRVLQVDTSIEPGLVALNVGSAAGVKRGMTFEIFNGRDYKGRVKVENVRDNMCSALILGTPRMAIGQGDSAATNL